MQKVCVNQPKKHIASIDPPKSASNAMHKTEMRQKSPPKNASKILPQINASKITPQKSASNAMHKTEMPQKSPPKNASKITPQINASKITPHKSASKFICVKIQCVKNH